MECKALTTVLGEILPSPLLLSFSSPFAVAVGSYKEQGVRVIKWREENLPLPPRTVKLANPRACEMSAPSPDSGRYDPNYMCGICQHRACGCGP